MKLNTTSILIGTVLCAVLSAPAYAGGSDRGAKTKPSGTKTVSTLLMSNSIEDMSDSELENQLKYLNFGVPENLIATHDDNMELVKAACFPTDKEVPSDVKSAAIIAPILTFLAPKLIGLFVKEVDKGLEKEIEKYSAVHSKKVFIKPYSKINGGNLELSSNCFRYSKFTESFTDEKTMGADGKRQIIRNSKRQLDFDFVGHWSVIDNNYIRVQPLRLYVGTPSVPKDSDELSLAISAKTSAVWRDENIGKSEDIFNTIILKEKLNKPDHKDGEWTKVLKFYELQPDDSEGNLEALSKFQPLPILPYSNVIFGKEETQDIKIRDEDNEYPLDITSPIIVKEKIRKSTNRSLLSPMNRVQIEDTIASLEISVAEVGDGARKKVLKLAKKGLGIFEDDITSVLEEAASELLEKETPVIEEVEEFCSTFTAILDENGQPLDNGGWTGITRPCE